MRNGFMLGALVLLSLLAYAEDKPIITVLDLTATDVSNSEVKSLVSMLSSALFRTGMYTVIDVTERDRLLKEVEFSASDCTDQSCQLEIGRMLSAELIVVGNIAKVGKRYVVSIKMLQTESARTMGTADGTYDSIDGVVDDVDTLASQLTGQAVRGSTRRPTVSVRRVVGYVGLAVGAAGAGTGGVLVATAVALLKGPVEDAYRAYAQLPQSAAQVDIDAAWAGYQAQWKTYLGRYVGGLAACGVGAAALVGSLLLVVLPERTPAPQSPGRVSVLIAPGAVPGGIWIQVRY
jgi:hypothetical protein